METCSPRAGALGSGVSPDPLLLASTSGQLVTQGVAGIVVALKDKSTLVTRTCKYMTGCNLRDLKGVTK